MSSASGRSGAIGAAAALVLAGGLAFAQTAPEIAVRAQRRAGLPARAAALLVSGQLGGPIAVAALAVPLAAGGNTATLGVAFDVEGTSLLGGRTTGTMPVDFAVYAVDDSGGVGASTGASVVLDLDHGAGEIARSGIKLLLTLDVPVTVTHLRALVYVADGPLFGVTEAPAGGLPGSASAPLVAPPVFSDPPSSWLLAAEAAPAGAPFPFVIGGAPLAPAARPVLVPGAEREAWLVSRGQPADLAGTDAAIVGSDGADIAPVDLEVVDRLDAGGLQVAHVTLAIPNLPAAAYGLRVTGAAGDGGARPASTLPVVIAPKSSGTEVVAWTTFAARRRSAPAAEAPGPATSGPVTLMEIATLKAAYLEALRQISLASRAAGVAAVADMETAAMTGGSPKEGKRLLAAESEATRDLISGDPGSLLALLALHLDLQRRYGQTSRTILQDLASTRVEELASAVAFRGGTPDSRALAVSALLCFASERYYVGDLVVASRMYRKVLFLDPANPIALAGLAGVLEAAGLFSQALEPLELLDEKHTGDAEARLRLAVNLYRAGKQKRAGTLLAGCTAPENPAWVRAVAYQEMVSYLIDDEKWPQASALLDEALAALPDDQGLNAQRAYVLDRSGRTVEARAAARRALRASSQPAPRYRYAHPPAPEAKGECSVLAPRRDAAEAALGKALTALSGRPR